MLKQVLRRLAPDTDEFHHAVALIDGLSLFYDVIKVNGIWLDPAAAEAACDGLMRAGVHHQSLCHLSMTRGRQLFYMTVKSHYAQHIGIDVLRSGFNPRFGWTYQDEDYMGRVAQVCKPCLKGRGPLRLGGALLFRWRCCMFIRWQRRTRP